MVKHIGNYTGSPSKLATDKDFYPDVIWKNVNQNPSREFDGKIYHMYGGQHTKTDAHKSASKVRSWGHGARVVKSGNYYQVFVRKGRG